MALQGTLDTFALPDVLRLLAATKKTGCLRITGGRGSGSLWIDDGGVSALEVAHAPHAVAPVDALFELLRFEEGAFTFDADVAHPAPGTTEDVEALLEGAETLLAEWREIESVVPSMGAWVTLRRMLGAPTVTIDQAHWTTLVAVGGGATVQHIADDLEVSELPASRAVRALVELGVVEVAPSAPAGRAAPPAQTVTHAPLFATQAPDAAAELDADAAIGEPAEAPEPAAASDPSDPDAPLPVARPLRARRPRSASMDADDTSGEPEPFVPLELPGQAPASYDPEPTDADDDTEPAPVDDLAAAFPGLASQAADPTPEDEELARQLATLSPRAAEAVRAAAEAETDEERDAALDEAVEGEEQPINRGLLLKFLSSVKG